MPKYKTKDLLVLFDSFEPTAKEEANSLVPQEEIDKLKEKLNNTEIWEILKYGWGLTVFFYTDQQKQTAIDTGYNRKVADLYFTILKKYDEFGYYHKDNFSISVDSKENFDTNYQSNWFYYFK